MPSTNYSYQASNEFSSVRCSVQSARCSFKNTREASRMLRGKKLEDALTYLAAVRARETCVPMRRYARGCGRTAQAKRYGTTRGRWPEKSCALLVYLLNNLKANAEFKKIDPAELTITHIQVNKAPKVYGRLHRAHGRVTPYNSSPCHVEIVAEKDVLQIRDGERVAIDA